MAGVGTNRYAYSFNDPVNLGDPGGNATTYYSDGRDPVHHHPDSPEHQALERGDIVGFHNMISGGGGYPSQSSNGLENTLCSTSGACAVGLIFDGTINTTSDLAEVIATGDPRATGVHSNRFSAGVAFLTIASPKSWKNLWGLLSRKKSIPINVPGRVRSRVNLANSGFQHVLDRHYDPTKNASQFTIAPSELRDLLQSPTVVQSPVNRVVTTHNSELRFIREVNVGRPIGLDKYDNYNHTSMMAVLTDKFGNLVTAHPGLSR